jgi:hypothetical protein
MAPLENVLKTMGRAWWLFLVLYPDAPEAPIRAALLHNN